MLSQFVKFKMKNSIFPLFVKKMCKKKERITLIHIVTLVLAVYVFVALYYYFFSFFSFALYYGISFQWQRQEWNDQELNRRYFESSCDYNDMKIEQEGDRVKFPLICLSIDKSTISKVLSIVAKPNEVIVTRELKVNQITITGRWQSHSLVQIYFDRTLCINISNPIRMKVIIEYPVKSFTVFRLNQSTMENIQFNLSLFSDVAFLLATHP